MSLSSCFCCKPAMFHQVKGKLHVPSSGVEHRSVFTLRGVNTDFSGRHIVAQGGSLGAQWSFVGGSRVTYLPQLTKFTPDRKRTTPAACWTTCSQIASSSFTWATVFVLPFYTLMVVAPNAAVTKKTMESNIPYIVLGILYTYLLYLSWTPDTLRSMFASKYLLPELPGMTKLFANEVTVSSAWIHLLTVDLFAARQVFKDGLENKIETRHSVSLCLLFCPIGILTHAITKALTKGDQYIHGGTKAPK